MNKKYKLIFILFLALFIVHPQSVFAGVYSTDSIQNYATTAPTGPQITNYLDGSTNYVNQSRYINEDKYVPIGALVKFYKYSPPDKPLQDEGTGTIYLINTVLFYNPNLINQSVDYYTHESTSYSGYRDWSDPHYDGDECGKYHTGKYEVVNHYTYSYKSLNVSAGSSDLKFDVDKVYEVDKFTFDSKDNYDKFAKDYLDYQVNTVDKMKEYFGDNFSKIDLNNLRQYYYSIEPVYVVYKAVKQSDLPTKSSTSVNKKTVTTSSHTGTKSYTYEKWCYDVCHARNDNGNCKENGKKVGTWHGQTCKPPGQWLICTQELPKPIVQYECGNVTFKGTTTFNYSCKFTFSNYYYEKGPSAGTEFESFITYTRNEGDGAGKFRDYAYNIAGEKDNKHLVATTLNGKTTPMYYIGPSLEEAMISYTSDNKIRIPETFAIKLYYQGNTVTSYTSFTVPIGSKYIPTTVGIKFYYFQIKVPPDECPKVCGDPNSSEQSLMCAINFCDNRAQDYNNVNKAKRECLINECKYKPPESNTCETLVNSPLFRDSEKDGADGTISTSYCGFTDSSKSTKSYNSSEFRGSYVTCSRMGQITSPSEVVKDGNGVIISTFYPYSDLQTYIDVACKETSTIDSVDISNDMVYPGSGINYTLTVKTSRKCVLSFDYAQWDYDYAGISKADDERKTLMLTKLVSWITIGKSLQSDPSINADVGRIYKITGTKDNPSKQLRFTWNLHKVEGELPRFSNFSVRNKANRTTSSGYVTEVVNNKLSTDGMLVYGSDRRATLEKIVTAASKNPYVQGGLDYAYYSFAVSSLPNNNQKVTIRNDLDFKVYDPDDPYYAWIKKTNDYDPPFETKYLLLHNHTGTHDIPKYVVNEGFSESYTFPSVCVSDDGNATVSLKSGSAYCKSTVGRGMSNQAKEGYKKYFTSLQATYEDYKTLNEPNTISGIVSIKKTDVNGHLQNGYYTVSDRCPYEVMGERISCSIGVEYTGSKRTMGFYNLEGDNKLTFKLNIKNNLQDNDKVTEYGITVNGSKSYNNLTEIAITANDIGNGSWYDDSIGTKTFTNTVQVFGVVKTQNGKEVTCTQDVRVNKLKESQYLCNYNYSTAFNFICGNGFVGDPDARTCISEYDVPKIKSDKFTCNLQHTSEAVGSDGRTGHLVVNNTGNKDGKCVADICIERSKYSCEMVNSSTCRLTNIDNSDLYKMNASSAYYNVTAVDSEGLEYSLDKAYKCKYTNCNNQVGSDSCKLPDFVDGYYPKATITSWAQNLDHKLTVRIFRVFDVLIPNGKILKQSYPEDTDVLDILADGGVIDLYISTDDEDYYTKENTPILIDTFTIGNESSCNFDKVYITSVSDLASKVSSLGRTISSLTVSAINGNISSYKEQIRKIYYPMGSDEYCDHIEYNVEYPREYEMICPPGTFHDRIDKCRDYGTPIATLWNTGTDVYFTSSGLENSYNGQQMVALKYEEQANGYYLSYDPFFSVNGETYLVFGDSYCKFKENEGIENYSCKEKFKDYAYNQTAISNYCLDYWRADIGSYSSYEECVSDCSVNLCPSDPTITQNYDKLVDWCKANYDDVGYSHYGLCINNCYPAGDGDYKYRPINLNNPFPYSKSTPDSYKTGNRATGKNWIGLDELAKVYNVYGDAVFSLNLNTKAIFRIKRYNQTLGLYNTNKNVANPYASKLNSNYYSSLMHSVLDSKCKKEGFCSVFVHEKFRDLFTKINNTNTSSWNGMGEYN